MNYWMNWMTYFNLPRNGYTPIDARGNDEQTSETEAEKEEIGPVWKFLYSILMLSLAILGALFMHAMVSYVLDIAHNPNDIHGFISSEALLSQLFAVIAIMLYVNIKPFIGMLRSRTYKEHLLSVPGIYKRLVTFTTDLTVCKTNFYLLVALLWPLSNIGLLWTVYIKVDEPIQTDYNCTRGMTLYTSIETPALLVFGGFTYAIYLLRMSFVFHMATVAEEKKSKEILEIENTVYDIWMDLEDYRSVVGKWVSFIIPVGALSLAVQWSWFINEQLDELTDFEIQASTLYAAWLWNRKLMLFLQPVIATGGFDIDNIWEDFQREYKKQLGRDDPEKLVAILDYMKTLNSDASAGSWISTVVVATLTIFVGVTLPEQNVWYWVRPGCTHPPITPDEA